MCMMVLEVNRGLCAGGVVVQGNEGRITVIKLMILRLPPMMGDGCGGAIILSVQQNGSGPSGAALTLLKRHCG